MKNQMFKIGETSDIHAGHLIITVSDEYGNLIFDLCLHEKSGRIEFRQGNSTTRNYLELNELRALLDKQEQRLREWAEDVKD